jgi:hypothetical protein
MCSTPTNNSFCKCCFQAIKLHRMSRAPEQLWLGLASAGWLLPAASSQGRQAGDNLRQGQDAHKTGTKTRLCQCTASCGFEGRVSTGCASARELHPTCKTGEYIIWSAHLATTNTIRSDIAMCTGCHSCCGHAGWLAPAEARLCRWWLVAGSSAQHGRQADGTNLLQHCTRRGGRMQHSIQVGQQPAEYCSHANNRRPVCRPSQRSWQHAWQESPQLERRLSAVAATTPSTSCADIDQALQASQLGSAVGPVLINAVTAAAPHDSTRQTQNTSTT